MKRSLFTQHLKQTLLAVPTCALMLGAAQAQSTVGLNFQSWYYDSGNTPQTVGYGNGYQTTGVPVTATAFGVGVADWTNSDPLPCAPFSASVPFGGTLNANVTAANMWESGFTAPGVWGISPGVSWYDSWPVGSDVVAAIVPGEYQVTWSFLDNTGWSVDVTGLNAKFPNGYAMALIGGDKTTASSAVTVTEDAGSTTVATVTFTVLPDSMGIGICPVLNNDAITLSNPSRDVSSANCALAGVILTDKPVVTRDVATAMLLSSGASLVLPTPTTIIGVGLTYQWQHAGTNIPGATFSSYTNNSVATTDAGLYSAVVTSSFYPSLSVTGQVASVSVVPAHAARSATFDANTGTTGAQDGSGTWGYTLVNWWSGSVDDYWGNPDSAVFGAGGTGAYSVALTASVTANSITFSSGAYTITNTAGETLTLSGSPALTAMTNGTIACPLTVTTNTLLKLGAGKVTLSGAFAGTNVYVGAGTLEVLVKTGGDATYTVTNGATLKLGYSTGGGYANSGMKLYGDGTSATTGLYLKGGTTYSVSGTPTLLGAPTTIRQYGSGLASFAIFDINSTGLYCTAAASGSAIDANIQMVNGGYGMSGQVDAGANTATGDLIVNGPLNIDGHNGIYGFVKRGLGSLRLNAAATTNNAGLDIRAGTAICGINNCIGGTNGTIKTSAGATIDLNGTSQTVSNAVLAGTLKMTINKGGSPNCNTLNCWSQPATFGGTLTVTNVGGTLALGDSFTLFPVPGSSAFTNLQLPAVGNGLAWQDNSTVDGTIKVVAGSTPPSIVTDLSGGTNYAFIGGNATLKITAAGDPVLHYQWKKNGTTVVGTDSATLTLTSLTTGSAGYYSCTVTNNFAPAAQSQTNYLVVVTPSAAVGTMVQDTPASLWPLSETDPATAFDYSSGNNGTQTGSLTLGAAGPVPPTDAGFNVGTLAYQFDGASAYLDCGTAPSLSGTTDFTVEAWINTTNATGSSTIIQQRSPSGFNGEYILGLNSSGTAHFTIFGGSATQFTLNTPANARRVNDGKWHHVAAVRSGLNGYLYVDGSLVASATGSAIAPLDATIATYIGADVRGSSSYFNGSLCDVAVYTTALSADRIGVHATTGWLGTAPMKVNLVAGGWVEDSKPSGTPHDGQNLGTTWIAAATDGASVTRSGVAQFASGAQVAIPANPDFNAPTGTICFWMQMAAPPAGNGVMLVDRRTSVGMVVTLDGTPSGGLGIQYNGNATFATSGSLIDGNWHHVALLYEQSASGSVSVYIDGAQVASQVNTAAWSWPTTQQIELGRSHDTYWQEFNGQLDDFRIYNRELTGGEISTVATPATSDTLIDTSALTVRYNFDTAGVGKGMSWSVGVLQGSPVIGPAAGWTTNTTTSANYPLLPRSSVTNSALFYRLKL